MVVENRRFGVASVPRDEPHENARHRREVGKLSLFDDEPLVRDGIGDLVASLGYRCVTFASSEEFLESRQVNNTVCLITDLNMPGLNGLDLQ